MDSWATRRRLLYGGSFVAIVAIITLSIYFKAVYHPPICTDGIQNGDETGIDCGGSCPNLCTADTLPPVVLWSKAFNVSGNLYSAAAYIENPNINSSNSQAAYVFRVYDANNNLLDSREGQTFIPKNERFVIFEPGFSFTNAQPKRVDFEFTSLGSWQKNTAADPSLTIDHTPLLATSSRPRVEGTVTNNSLVDVGQIELSALILDGKSNTVAVSRTFVDSVAPGASQPFVFTWPKPFDLGVEACLNPLDIVLVLDRSSSMKSESIKPPEPFSTVQSVAENFISALSDQDQVSVISFGTHAREDSPLSADISSTGTVIGALSLSTSTEETNIGEGLAAAFDELRGKAARTDSKKAIILLTDGIPNQPATTTQRDYPRIYAESVAQSIRAADVTVYTVGLGTSVDAGFLKNIATDADHYFFAPTKETLGTIYSQIGSALCPKKPNAIQVIYRLVP